MILKYAYAYANPTGTFYVGYPDGVNTIAMSATFMSTIANQHGSVLVEVRRQIKDKLGTTKFELVNVTPQSITDRGLVSGEEIKDLYERVKFDVELQKAVDDYSKKVHEYLVELAAENFDYCKSVKEAMQKLVSLDIVVDAQIDPTDPTKINVHLKVPLSHVIINPGVFNGSHSRS